jgi:hypothetical protein
LEGEGRPGVAAFDWFNPPLGHNVDRAFPATCEEQEIALIGIDGCQKTIFSQQGLVSNAQRQEWNVT